jgi:mannose-6-phosphate isomerase-like protein (cupin superfamily)
VTIGLLRSGASELIPDTAGPPRRVDGFSVGAPLLTREPPHAGEMHPDGDELLYVVSGRVSLLLELPGGERTLELAAGDAAIVPRGIWHRVRLREPTRLLHITPGPGGAHRPLAAAR